MMKTEANPLTQTQLENQLWESANILRGPIDAADFKTYIFPMLFFKRISDVFDEEVHKALEESGGDEEYAYLDEMHRLVVSKEQHWRDVFETTENIGSALDKAFRAIERENECTLYGIFGDAQWTNKARLPDALYRERQEVDGKVCLVSRSEIVDNDDNLNIARYVQKVTDEQTIPASEVLKDFKAKMGALETEESRLETLLKHEGSEL